MDHSHHDHHGHAPAMPTASTTNASSLAETIVPRQEHDHGGGTGDNSTTAVHNMMMNMAFHTGYSETILFDFWKTSDTWGMLGSAVFIFFIAFAYEALKFYREHLYRSSFRAIQYNTVTVPVENGGAVKETHKTVQVSGDSGGGPYFKPDIVVPIVISQTNCACKDGQLGNNSCAAERESEYEVSGQNSGFPTTSLMTLPNTQYASKSCPSCGLKTEKFKIPNIHRSYKVKMFSGVHSLQTILHVVQTIISYFLMLIFMTYNVWLCLAVALGAGIGYFFFGWKKSLVVDITEHCH